jgi:hypothetical protein
MNILVVESKAKCKTLRKDLVRGALRAALAPPCMQACPHPVCRPAPTLYAGLHPPCMQAWPPAAGLTTVEKERSTEETNGAPRPRKAGR